MVAAGQRLAFARGQRGDCGGVQNDVRQRIGQLDAGERQVARVLDLELVGDQVVRLGRGGKGSGVEGLGQGDVGVPVRRDWRRVRLVRIRGASVVVWVRVGAIVGGIGDRVARESPCAGRRGLVFEPSARGTHRRQRHRGLRPQADGDGAGAGRRHREPGGKALFAVAVEPGHKAATGPAGRRKHDVASRAEGVHRWGAYRGQCPEQRHRPGQNIRHLDPGQALATEVLHNDLEGHIEGPVGVDDNRPGDLLGQADPGLRVQGEIVVGAGVIVAQRDVHDGGRGVAAGTIVADVGDPGQQVGVRRAAATDRIGARGQVRKDVVAVRIRDRGERTDVAAIVGGAGQCHGDAGHAGILGQVLRHVFVVIPVHRSRDLRRHHAHDAAGLVVVLVVFERCRGGDGGVGEILRIGGGRQHLHRQSDDECVARGDLPDRAAERGSAESACAGARRIGRGRRPGQHHAGRQRILDHHKLRLVEADPGVRPDRDLVDEIILQRDGARRCDLAHDLDVGAGANGGVFFVAIVAGLRIEPVGDLEAVDHDLVDNAALVFSPDHDIDGKTVAGLQIRQVTDHIAHEVSWRGGGRAGIAILQPGRLKADDAAGQGVGDHHIFRGRRSAVGHGDRVCHQFADRNRVEPAVGLVDKKVRRRIRDRGDDAVAVGLDVGFDRRGRHLRGVGQRAGHPGREKGTDDDRRGLLLAVAERAEIAGDGISGGHLVAGGKGGRTGPRWRDRDEQDVLGQRVDQFHALGLTQPVVDVSGGDRVSHVLAYRDFGRVHRLFDRDVDPGILGEGRAVDVIAKVRVRGVLRIGGGVIVDRAGISAVADLDRDCRAVRSGGANVQRLDLTDQTAGR